MTLYVCPSHQLYIPELSRQWAEWVETENAEGSRQIEGKLLVGTFDLSGGKELTDSTLYLHSRQGMIDALENAGLVVQETTTMGYKETYSDGLYITISGHKDGARVF